MLVDKNTHMSVLEYINKIQYSKKLNDVPYILEEDKINVRIEIFALKLVNNKQLKNFYYNNSQVFKIILKTGKMHNYLKKLSVNLIGDKTEFMYTRYQILNFLSFLHQAHLEGYEEFRKFIRIPDVYKMLENLYYSDLFFYDFINIKGLPLYMSDLVRILNILGILKREYKEDFYLKYDSGLMCYGIKSYVESIEICVTPELFKIIQGNVNIKKVSSEVYKVADFIEITVLSKEKFKCKQLNYLLVEDIKLISKRKQTEIKKCKDEEQKRILNKELNRLNNFSK